MANRKLIYLLFSVAIILVSLDAARSETHYSILPKNIICNCSTAFIRNATCEINRFNRTQKTFTVDFEIQPNVTLYNMFVKVSVLYKGPSQIRYHPYLGINNLTIDLCKFIGGENNMLLEMFTNGMEKYGNFMQPCPRMGRVYVKDYVFNDSKMLQIMPLGDYMLQMYYYTKINKAETFSCEQKVLVELVAKRLK